MDACSPQWYGLAALGGGAVAAMPALDTAPARAAGTAIGVAVGLWLVIAGCRRLVALVASRLPTPGVMTPRAWTAATLVAYAYVAVNVGVLFPVGTQPDPSLVAVAWFYAAVLAALWTVGGVAYRRTRDAAVGTA